VIALVWIGVVAFFAVLAPVLASGHPLIMHTLDESGQRTSTSSPLLENLRTADWLMLIGALLAPLLMLLPGKATRPQRLGMFLAGAAQAGTTAIFAQLIASFFAARDAPDWARAIELRDWFIPAAAATVATLIALAFAWIPSTKTRSGRISLVTIVALISAIILWQTWRPTPAVFDYDERIAAGKVQVIHTLIPWSPSERPGDRDAKFFPPGSTSDQPLAKVLISGLPITGPLAAPDVDRAMTRIDTLPLPDARRATLRASLSTMLARNPTPTRDMMRIQAEQTLAGSGRPFYLGTDGLGQDVLSQLLHACRLAISIGLVSTGIAVLIGVTIGALMGYFGGLIDLLLYRVVEVFMAVPLLFILIVAAGVLPRNTYIMMAIIGCFTWTGAARFTRAEFLKLRNQDFVHSARAVGLPLRSILFRHMLPNGITPVLVDASFAIAFAIILEATLSYLGLGPTDQASWGRLLASATSESGDFVWWLAMFPGLAIFLAALSYNLLGEALRDAIDPKRSKPRT
jgi:ABC-type dipeptide/oligopeptide/nickel transport system permease subunit